MNAVCLPHAEITHADHLECRKADDLAGLVEHPEPPPLAGASFTFPLARAGRDRRICHGLQPADHPVRMDEAARAFDTPFRQTR